MVGDRYRQHSDRSSCSRQRNQRVVTHHTVLTIPASAPLFVTHFRSFARTMPAAGRIRNACSDWNVQLTEVSIQPRLKKSLEKEVYIAMRKFLFALILAVCVISATIGPALADSIGPK